MALSYNRMWKLLVDKKMSKADLRKAADIAPNTMTKLRRDEAVNLAILGRIWRMLGNTRICRIHDDNTAVMSVRDGLGIWRFQRLRSLTPLPLFHP